MQIENERMEKHLSCKENEKNTKVGILITDKMGFKTDCNEKQKKDTT